MTFEAIGQKLKSAREAQGLSLRQIYERTKIPINHLQALDSGQPDDLPEPVYVAGFIKRYAECIGLDGQVLADEYRRLDGNGNGKPKTMQQPVYVTQDYLRHTRIDNRTPSYKLWPFYAAVIVVFIGVLSWFSSQSSNNQQSDSMNSLKNDLSHVEQQTPPPTPASGTLPQTGTQPADAANPASGATQANSATGQNPDSLKLSANKHVWVEVKKLDTGERLFTGFLEQGQEKIFPSYPAGFRVTAGNGGSLSAEFKGKIEPFGEAGKKTERVFAATTADASAAKEHTAATSTPATATSGTTATSGSATGSSGTTASKPKKPARKPDTQTAARHWQGDETGTRSIPGEDGARSIDVPYRYSEGRLDAN